MIQINVIKIMLFCAIGLFYTAPIMAQEIPSEKIYFLFKENDGGYSDALGKKFVNEGGINFNLYKNYFTHKKSHSRDTLSICKLENYTITKESELKEKEIAWRKENEAFLKKYFGGVWVIDRNGVFDPYIIEKIGNGKIVVYEVEFRNEGAKP